MAPKFMDYIPTNLMPFIGVLLRFVGVLPTSRAGLCYSVLVTVYLLFSVTPQFIDLWMRLDSLSNALANISLTAVIFGAFLGQVLILKNHKTLTSLFSEVKEDYKAFLDSSELARKHLRSSHILVITLCIIVITTMTLYVLEPLLTQSNQLVLHAWYPFSVEDEANYVLIYMYQSFTVAFGGTLILSANTIFCEVNLHTIAHLEHLCQTIRHAVKISNYPQGPTVEREMNRRLALCAQRHALLLRRIEYLAKTFSAASMIDYVFCMICVATLGLETIGVEEDIPFMQIAKSCALLACATLTLFPPCLIAQQTVEAQLKVAHATSDYYVVEAPESVKRTMQIINIRAQVPKNLSVGGLLEVNLVTYGEALKLAYGIFTMLHHFKS